MAQRLDDVAPRAEAALAVFGKCAVLREERRTVGGGAYVFQLLLGSAECSLGGYVAQDNLIDDRTLQVFRQRTIGSHCAHYNRKCRKRGNDKTISWG